MEKELIEKGVYVHNRSSADPLLRVCVKHHDKLGTFLILEKQEDGRYSPITECSYTSCSEPISILSDRDYYLLQAGESIKIEYETKFISKPDEKVHILKQHEMWVMLNRDMSTGCADMAYTMIMNFPVDYVEYSDGSSTSRIVKVKDLLKYGFTRDQVEEQHIL